MRTNRAITFFMYAILLITISVISIFILDRVIYGPGETFLVGLSAAGLAGLISILFYPRFQRWLDTRLLGMPLPPASLIEAYTARITTSLELPKLVNLIRNEMLPSLLIRQAALLRLTDNLPSTLFTLELEDNQLPRAEEIPNLLKEAGRLRSLESTTGEASPCPWARIILSLSLEGKPMGLCLLGRRDPDDVYSASEIPMLQALMNQTAMALLNIEQAERIHLLYRVDIERREAESSQLALELHDDVLGQMAMLAMNAAELSPQPKFEQAYQSATAHIRDIINGLRPTMLNYGLRAAIDELADETQNIYGSSPEIQVRIPPSSYRYPPMVELHLFRIIQQACKNAIQHSYGSLVSISGDLEAERANLMVEDNGVGFAHDGHLDLDWLLAHKHFGLAGMHERAALIGARLEIRGGRQAGTCVQVTWAPGEARLARESQDS